MNRATEEGSEGGRGEKNPRKAGRGGKIEESDKKVERKAMSGDNEEMEKKIGKKLKKLLVKRRGIKDTIGIIQREHG